MRISDWSSDVCSSDLVIDLAGAERQLHLDDILVGPNDTEAECLGKGLHACVPTKDIAHHDACAPAAGISDHLAHQGAPQPLPLYIRPHDDGELSDRQSAV